MLSSNGLTPSIHTLSNGLRLIHKPCHGALSCCGLVVKAGSRQDGEEAGMAHFTEHMLFKGTAKRKPHQILNRMERVGGELNAYTTKEETFVYSLFLKKDYRRALELVSDLFFNASFPEASFETERTIILDEINAYEDSPSELIFDDFDHLFYPGHPLGRRILGLPETVNALTRDDMVAFHRRQYTTQNVAFYSQAPLPFSKVVALAEHYLGSLPMGEAPKNGASVKPSPAKGFRQEMDKDTHQAHVVCGGESFSLFEPARTGLYFLNNILGGPGMNSRLNLSMREKSGLVYSVESNVTSFTDTGLFTVYFGTDPKDVERCLALLHKELKRLCEVPLTSLQWHAARKQLLGQVQISAENKENNTLSMGKSLLYFNHYDSLETLIAKIEAFTPSRLRDLANQVFHPDNLSTLIYR